MVVLLALGGGVAGYAVARAGHEPPTPMGEVRPLVAVDPAYPTDLPVLVREDRDEPPLAIHSDEEQALAQSLEQIADDVDERQRLVQTQLALICRQLAPLRTLAAHLQKDRH